MLRLSIESICFRFITALTTLVIVSSLAAADINPQLIGTWGGGAGPGYVALSGQYAYVLDDGNSYPVSLRVIDLTDRANPRPLSSLPITGFPQRLTVSGHYAYIAAYVAGLQIIDISNPAQPRRLGAFDTRGSAVAVAVSGTRAYVLEYRQYRDGADASPGAVLVIDITDLAKPAKLGEYVIPRTAPGSMFAGLALSGDIVSIATWGSPQDSPEQSSLDFLDVTDPRNPKRVGGSTAKGRVNGAVVAMSGNFAYWAPTTIDSTGTRRYSLEIFDVTDPTSPKKVGTYKGSGEATSISVFGNYVYIAKTTQSGTGTFEIIDVKSPVTPVRAGGASLAARSIAALDANISVIAAGSFGLHIYDVSNPESPRRLGLLSSGTHIASVAADGHLALVALDPIQVLDIADSQNPKPLGAFSVGGYVSHMKISGNYAYVAAGLNGFNIIDLTNPSTPRRLGTYRPSSAIWDVAVSGNYAYLADVEVGLHVIDITKPSAPRRIGGQRARFSGNSATIAVSGAYVFLAERGNYEGVVEVFDVSTPTDPQWVGVYEALGPTSNIAIEGKYAFVTGVWYEGNDSSAPRHGFLDILDITDPANPRLSARNSFPNSWAGTVTVSGERAYLGRSQRDDQNGNYLDIFDIKDPSNPQRIGGFQFGSHSMAVAGNQLYLAAQRNGLLVLDLSAPASLQRTLTLGTDGEAYGLPFSQNYVYVANGSAGIQVLKTDASQPPQRLATFQTLGTARDVAVSAGHAYVAEGKAGLEVLDISNPVSLKSVGSYDSSGEAFAVVVSGNLAYIANGNEGVQVLSIEDPANPKRLGVVPTTGKSLGLALYGSYLLAANREAGLEVLDVSNPSSPKSIANYNSGGLILTVAISGSYGYVADGANGFQVIDLTDPKNPTMLSMAPGSVLARGISVHGRFAYVSDANSGLQVYDISDPTRPQLRASNSAVDPYDVAVSGERVYVAASGSGLSLFPLFTPPLSLQASLALSGGLNLRLEGPAGLAVRIQRSTDLKTWTDWKLGQLTASPLLLQDLPTRATFYRAVSQ